MNTSPTRTQWVLIVTLALASAPYFVRLGASSLWDSNEAFYAETPREMIESADYVNPTFNYRPRLNKPPLSYWLVVPFYKLFGVSEASERLPIVLGALLMIAAAYGLGRAAFSIEAGLIAAIVLAASPRFLMFSRRILIDVYLAMFMSMALLMFVLAERLPNKRRVCLLIMYACVGFGVMTKGPVAIALPAAVLLIYLAFYRRLNALREMMLPAGILIIAAIVLPWYIAIYSQHGWTHIETFILKDNLSRYTQQVWGPRRGPFFYVPVIIGDLFPWSLFLIPSAILAGWTIWARWKQARSEVSISFLLGVWIVAIVVFFSFSRSKEDLYILPVYPAAAALIGGTLSKAIGSIQLNRETVPRLTSLVVAFVVTVAGVAVLYLFGTRTQLYALEGATLIGWIGIVGGVVATVAALLNRMRMVIITTALTFAACNWVFALWMLPSFERYKPVRSFSEEIAAEAGPDALVGYYRMAYPSMVFYLRRPIFEYYDQSEIENAFSSGREVFCIMNSADYEAIKSGLEGETRVLASRPIFQVKLKGILDRVDLPKIVLISNKGGMSVTR